MVVRFASKYQAKKAVEAAALLEVATAAEDAEKEKVEAALIEETEGIPEVSESARLEESVRLHVPDINRYDLSLLKSRIFPMNIRRYLLSRKAHPLPPTRLA